MGLSLTAGVCGGGMPGVEHSRSTGLSGGLPQVFAKALVSEAGWASGSSFSSQ